MCARASHPLVSQTLTFAYYACDSFYHPTRMTLENLLSQVGLGSKQLTDRYSEYGAPMPEQHVYYAYEHSPPPTTVAPAASSKHHHSSGGGLKTNASMSALTLLAFLFFLHILQQCIKDHMTEMSTSPGVMVMSAGREGEVDLLKSDKIDKTGISQIDSVRNQIKSDALEEKINAFQQDIETDSTMTKIKAAEHKPRNDYKYVYRNTDQTSFPGFVSAMDEK